MRKNSLCVSMQSWLWKVIGCIFSVIMEHESISGTATMMIMYDEAQLLGRGFQQWVLKTTALSWGTPYEGCVWHIFFTKCLLSAHCAPNLHRWVGASLIWREFKPKLWPIWGISEPACKLQLGLSFPHGSAVSPAPAHLVWLHAARRTHKNPSPDLTCRGKRPRVRNGLFNRPPPTEGYLREKLMWAAKVLTRGFMIKMIHYKFISLVHWLSRN